MNAQISNEDLATALPYLSIVDHVREMTRRLPMDRLALASAPLQTITDWKDAVAEAQAALASGNPSRILSAHARLLDCSDTEGAQ